MTVHLKNSPALVRQISAAETYPIRSRVLRPGKPLQECIFEGDESTSTLHFGAYIDDKLVGVASYMENSNPMFDATSQYQLRGMAVLPEFQKKKLGELLLLEGEKKLREKQSSILLWFNARETATDFYKRYDYSTKGEAFMIPNVCMHVVMFKEL